MSNSDWIVLLAVIGTGNLATTLVAWAQYVGAKQDYMRAMPSYPKSAQIHEQECKKWAPLFFISPFIGTFYWTYVLIKFATVSATGSVRDMAVDTISVLPRKKEKSPAQLSLTSEEGGELSPPEVK